MLFWIEVEAGQTRVRALRCPAGSDTWIDLGAIESLLPFSIYPSAVKAVVDTAGVVTFGILGTRLYTLRHDPGTGSWSTPARLDVPTSSSYLQALQMATTPSNAVAIAWIQSEDPQGLGVYVAWHDSAAGGWSASERVSSSVMQHMSMSVDDANAIALAWSTGGSLAASSSVWTARWSPSQPQWTTPYRLDRSDIAGSDSPALVASPSGHVTAVWLLGSAMQASRFDPDSVSWSKPELVGAIGTQKPNLASDVAGNITIASVEQLNVATAWRFSASEQRWLAGMPLGRPTTGELVFANATVLVAAASGDVTLAWYAWHRDDGVDRYVTA